MSRCTNRKQQRKTCSEFQLFFVLFCCFLCFISLFLFACSFDVVGGGGGFCLLFVYLLLCCWAFSSEVIISILLTHIKENFATTKATTTKKINGTWLCPEHENIQTENKNRKKFGFRFFTAHIIHLNSNTTSSSV